jgi:hypothetical protein
LEAFFQNGFTNQAEAGKVKNNFIQLLVYSSRCLQNGFTLQYLDLRKIDETEAEINPAKQA